MLVICSFVSFDAKAYFRIEKIKGFSHENRYSAKKLFFQKVQNMFFKTIYSKNNSFSSYFSQNETQNISFRSRETYSMARIRN